MGRRHYFRRALWARWTVVRVGVGRGVVVGGEARMRGTGLRWLGRSIVGSSGFWIGEGGLVLRAYASY